MPLLNRPVSARRVSNKEQYAFEDYLNSDMSREEAEHDWHKKKAKPTYNTEYNPDKSQIDFQRGAGMSSDPYQYSSTVKEKREGHIYKINRSPYSPKKSFKEIRQEMAGRNDQDTD